MNDIEKMARGLLAAEFERINFQSEIDQLRSDRVLLPVLGSIVRAIVVALTIREGELLAGGSVNLLDQQHSGVVVAQALNVVPTAALGADEAGAVGIGGQGDQSVGVELAEVATEHEVGLLPANDGHVTPQILQRARQLVARAMEENRDPEFAKAVLTGRYDKGNSVKAVSAALALIPQWQPIETAPRDSVTAFLGWDGYDMQVTYWYVRPRYSGWYKGEDQYETFFWEPTHWMPLPAAPEVSP